MAKTIEDAEAQVSRVDEALVAMGLGEAGIACVVRSAHRLSGDTEYYPAITVSSFREVDDLVARARQQGLLGTLVDAQVFMPSKDEGEEGRSFSLADFI